MTAVKLPGSDGMQAILPLVWLAMLHDAILGLVRFAIRYPVRPSPRFVFRDDRVKGA
jgi:hypothetical protein